MDIEDKITKIWGPVEKLLNASLKKTGFAIMAARPKWLVSYFIGFKTKVIHTGKLIKNKILESNKKSKDYLFLQISKVLSIKSSISKSIDRVLKTIKNTTPKDIKDGLKLQMKSLYIGPMEYIKSQPLKKSFASAIAISFFMWGGYNIYYSKELYDKHSKIGRSIASLNVDKDLSAEYKKPKYHLKRLKTLQLTNVELPVFFSKVNQYKTINVDFSIISSNKHIVIFLDEKEELLRDHLMMNVEQVLPEFLVGTAGEAGKEGKEIIRKKIIRETNIFLEQYKVTGEIEEVRVGNILANP